MDNLVSGFSLLGIASLAVAIFIITMLVRRTLEFFLPVLKKKEVTAAKQKVAEYSNQWARFYNELGLYYLPYVVGSIIAAFPIEFVFGSIKNYGGRWVFCTLVATFCALFFKSIKKGIPALFGVQVEESDKLIELPPGG